MHSPPPLHEEAGTMHLPPAAATTATLSAPAAPGGGRGGFGCAGGGESGGGGAARGMATSVMTVGVRRGHRDGEVASATSARAVAAATATSALLPAAIAATLRGPPPAGYAVTTAGGGAGGGRGGREGEGGEGAGEEGASGVAALKGRAIATLPDDAAVVTTGTRDNKRGDSRWLTHAQHETDTPRPDRRHGATTTTSSSATTLARTQVASVCALLEELQQALERAAAHRRAVDLLLLRTRQKLRQEKKKSFFYEQEYRRLCMQLQHTVDAFAAEQELLDLPWQSSHQSAACAAARNASFLTKQSSAKDGYKDGSRSNINNKVNEPTTTNTNTTNTSSSHSTTTTSSSMGALRRLAQLLRVQLALGLHAHYHHLHPPHLKAALGTTGAAERSADRKGGGRQVTNEIRKSSTFPLQQAPVDRGRGGEAHATTQRLSTLGGRPAGGPVGGPAGGGAGGGAEAARESDEASASFNEIPQNLDRHFVEDPAFRDSETPHDFERLRETGGTTTRSQPSAAQFVKVEAEKTKGKKYTGQHQHEEQQQDSLQSQKREPSQQHKWRREDEEEEEEEEQYYTRKQTARQQKHKQKQNQQQHWQQIQQEEQPMLQNTPQHQYCTYMEASNIEDNICKEERRANNKEIEGKEEKTTKKMWMQQKALQHYGHNEEVDTARCHMRKLSTPPANRSIGHDRNTREPVEEEEGGKEGRRRFMTPSKWDAAGGRGAAITDSRYYPSVVSSSRSSYTKRETMDEAEEDIRDISAKTSSFGGIVASAAGPTTTTATAAAAADRSICTPSSASRGALEALTDSETAPPPIHAEKIRIRKKIDSLPREGHPGQDTCTSHRSSKNNSDRRPAAATSSAAAATVACKWPDEQSADMADGMSTATAAIASTAVTVAAATAAIIAGVAPPPQESACSFTHRTSRQLNEQHEQHLQQYENTQQSLLHQQSYQQQQQQYDEQQTGGGGQSGRLRQSAEQHHRGDPNSSRLHYETNSSDVTESELSSVLSSPASPGQRVRTMLSAGRDPRGQVEDASRSKEDNEEFHEGKRGLQQLCMLASSAATGVGNRRRPVFVPSLSTAKAGAGSWLAGQREPAEYPQGV